MASGMCTSHCYRDGSAMSYIGSLSISNVRIYRIAGQHQQNLIKVKLLCTDKRISRVRLWTEAHVHYCQLGHKGCQLISSRRKLVASASKRSEMGLNNFEVVTCTQNFVSP